MADQSLNQSLNQSALDRDVIRLASEGNIMELSRSSEPADPLKAAFLVWLKDGQVSTSWLLSYFPNIWLEE